MWCQFCSIITSVKCKELIMKGVRRHGHTSCITMMLMARFLLLANVLPNAPAARARMLRGPHDSLKSPPTLCTTTHLFPLATSSSTPETPSLTTSRKTPGMSTCMQPVCLCRRTPFMISSLHFTVVVMLIMKMSTRRDCGSVCNLYASAVGLSSL